MSRRAVAVLSALSIAALACVVTGEVGPAAAQAVTPYRVLILGDSYSAGNGSDSYTFSSTTGCYRSSQAWGQVLAEKLASTTSRPIEILNRACSSATTADITKPQGISSEGIDVPITMSQADIRAQCEAAIEDPGTRLDGGSIEPAFDEHYEADPGRRVVRCVATVPAQRDWVDQSFDLVVMTLGGNDIGFDRIAKHCLVDLGTAANALLDTLDVNDCYKDLDRATWLMKAGPGTGPSDRNRGVQARLSEAVATVHGRLNADRPGDQGQVLLLSYPYLLRNFDYDLASIVEPPAHRVLEGLRIKNLQDLGDTLAARVMASNAQALTSDGGCDYRTAVFGGSTKVIFGAHSPVAPIKVNSNTDSWWLRGIVVPIASAVHPSPPGSRAMADAAYSAVLAGGINGRIACTNGGPDSTKFELGPLNVGDIAVAQNGDMVVHSLFGSASLNLFRRTPSGGTAWDVPYGQPYGTGQYDGRRSLTPVISPAGDSLFVRADGNLNNAELVSVRQNGTVRWSTNVDISEAGGYAQPYISSSGTVLLPNVLEAEPAAWRYGVLELDPVTGARLRHLPIGQSRQLWPVDDGLVSVSTANTVRWYTRDGSIQAEVPIPPQYFYPLADSNPDGQWAGSADRAGNVTLWRMDPCSSQSHDATIARLTPAGLKWERTIPGGGACASPIVGAYALPDGGAVIVSGGTEVRAFNADGTDRWSTDVQPGPASEGWRYSNGVMRSRPTVVDASGRVIFVSSADRTTMLPGTTSYVGQSRWWLISLDGQTGGTSVLGQGDFNSDKPGYTMAWSTGFGNGRAYVTASEQSPDGIENPHTVYSFAAPGLIGPYPAGDYDG